jgi:hypothetical protein
MEATVSATKVSDATMSRDFDYRWQQVIAPVLVIRRVLAILALATPAPPASASRQPDPVPPAVPPGRDRACDQPLRRRLLYPLSYRGNVRSPSTPTHNQCWQ